MVQISILISLIGFPRRRYISLLFFFILCITKNRINGKFCYEDTQRHTQHTPHTHTHTHRQVLDDLRKVQNSFPIVPRRALRMQRTPLVEISIVQLYSFLILTTDVRGEEVGDRCS